MNKSHMKQDPDLKMHLYTTTLRVFGWEPKVPKYRMDCPLEVLQIFKDESKDPWNQNIEDQIKASKKEVFLKPWVHIMYISTPDERVLLTKWAPFPRTIKGD